MESTLDLLGTQTTCNNIACSFLSSAVHIAAISQIYVLIKKSSRCERVNPLASLVAIWQLEHTAGVWCLPCTNYRPDTYVFEFAATARSRPPLSASPICFCCIYTLILAGNVRPLFLCFCMIIFHSTAEKQVKILRSAAMTQHSAGQCFCTQKAHISQIRLACGKSGKIMFLRIYGRALRSYCKT